MLRQIISATEMSRDLSNILNEVRYHGKSFEIQRGKEIIARIIPVTISKNRMMMSELKDLLAHLPSLDKKDRQDFSNTIAEIRSTMDRVENPWD